MAEGHQRNILWKPSQNSIATSDSSDGLFTFPSSQVPGDREEILIPKGFLARGAFYGPV